jgi:hypothetical protein
MNRPRLLGHKIIIKQPSFTSTCADILSGTKTLFSQAPAFVVGDDKGGAGRPHLTHSWHAFPITPSALVAHSLAKLDNYP